MDDLRRFDLNLLVAFDALIAERSVTAAARRLGVGQPAMSNALARLRDMFGDPLLCRGADGMQPTGRALDLVEPVARVLADLRRDVFSSQTSFRPDRDERTFRVGCTDQAEVALMRDVLRTIRATAPGVHLIARTVEMRLGAELLNTGAIDLAIGYFPQAEGDLELSALYHENLVCMFDAPACGVSGPLSLDDFADLPHVLVSLRGEPFGHLDDLLLAAGRRRAVVYTTPHFLAVPFLLHGLRAVASLPGRLARNCAHTAGLTTCPVPLPSNGYDVCMAWHRRSRANPAHVWLRGIISAVADRQG